MILTKFIFFISMNQYISIQLSFNFGNFIPCFVHAADSLTVITKAVLSNFERVITLFY